MFCIASCCYTPFLIRIGDLKNLFVMLRDEASAVKHSSRILRYAQDDKADFKTIISIVLPYQLLIIPLPDFDLDTFLGLPL